MKKRILIAFLFLLGACLCASAEEKKLDPLIIKDSLVCPIEQICLDLGITVTRAENKIHLEKDDCGIDLVIGSKNAVTFPEKNTISLSYHVFSLVNNETRESRIFAPIRPIADAFHLNLSISKEILAIGDKSWTIDLQKSRIVNFLTEQRSANYLGISAIRSGLISSAKSGKIIEPFDKKPKGTYDYAGIFRAIPVASKAYDQKYNCMLKWIIRIKNGHLMHQYPAGSRHLLGMRASHGCVRMDADYAEATYRWLTKQIKAGLNVEIWSIN